MDILFDWETEGDRFSFEDSDRFEEDSLCSWISEPESLCNNWRGWKRQNGGQPVQLYRTQDGQVKPLVELTAQAVACHIPFEVVEHFPQPIPEQLQLRIAFWSFPENEEDIRLYSCLANGSAEEFQKGEHLYKAKAVKETLQIGFHLSATVIPPQPIAQTKGTFSVAVVFDRRRISSCTCTCNSNPSWCAHVVALCLYRIHQASTVCLRAPVSESLSRLHREQLQKFAQYLISELPQQILPTAQRLLDELLSSQQTAINTVCGAPDPTAGPSANEQTSWCLDENTLHDNVKKTLIKFCVPAPVVFSDVNYLTSTAPPAAAEWQSLLRPLRGREPEGMWNLLSIVREMFRRSDSNAVPLLEIITDETLQCEQILIWWFSSKISVSHSSSHGRNNNNGSSSATQNAAASLCDEIVTLWRFAALNPKLSPIQRDDLCAKFKDWHMGIIDKVRKARGPNINGPGTVKKGDIEGFVGFKPAVEACQLDWTEYKIPGVTFPEHSTWRYIFTRVNENEGKKPSRVQPMSICSEDIISTDGSTTLAQASSMYEELGLSTQDKCHVYNTRREMNRVKRAISDGACSSGSEGFCDVDRDPLLRDSDSSCEKDMNSRSNSIEEPDIVNLTPNMIQLAGNANLENGAVGGSLNSKVLPAPDVAVNPEHLAAENKDVTSDPKASLPCENPLLEPLSESQQSSDEYQLYLFDPKMKAGILAEKKKKDKYEEPDYFAGIKCMESQQEVLFAQAEALYAHGLTRQACILARQLAEELLTNPPDLLVDSSSTQAPKGKKKKATHNISILVSSLVSRAAFLCSVLSEEVDCHHLAFKVGMYGLEMPRPPASTKALEVKIAYQETELVTLLKKIPLGPAELGILRERAEQLRDGTLRSRGEALLPLMLASFTFDSLCLPACPVSGCNSRPPSRSLQTSVRLPSDEKLGFDAAVAALGLKAKVSEADHPLLCECSRRQRGDLAIAMLFHYKDDQVKLSKIMDKLLDKEVHQLYKAPSLATYLSSKPTSHHPVVTTTCQGQSAVFCQANASRQEAPSHQFIPKAPVTPLERSPAPSDDTSTLECSPDSSDWPEQSPQRLDYLNLEHTGPGTQLNATASTCPPRPKLNYRHSSGKDTDSSALEDDGDDLKALEAKIRCMSIKKKPSQGMASIDSSAPETTSSDNSPTLIRRSWGKPQGPGSDSGSSGKSSASLGSNSSGHKASRAKLRENESPPSPYVFRMSASQLIVDSRSSTPNIKGISFSRHKGKTRIMPTVPNQPSEASAHFMCELAKIVLTKAGGNSSTSLFNPQPSTNNNHTGPHRALHLCAFQIGLYALGLHNCVSPNWLSRTYSSHVSWISGQAMEIGSASINILIDTWEGHLTPQEVISLADRASRGRDPNMQRAAAELALSCLPHAQALNPAEVHRALFQCKEISIEMLQKACMAVENAAKSGGVFPEVLFDVARRWFELAEEATSLSQSNNIGNVPNHGDGAPPPVAVSQACVERSSPTNHHAMAFNPSPAPNQPQNTLPLQLLPHAPGQVSPQAVIIPYTIASTNHHHPRIPPHSTYVTPYSYVQQLQPFPHFQPVQMPHHIQHTYVATYPYQNQPQFPANTPPIYATNPAQLRPLQLYAANHACSAAPVQNLPGQMAPPVVDQQNLPPAAAMQQGATAQVQAQHISQNSAQMTYLLACYRVGMLAMETLARRLHETKFARNPPNGEDIKWLLGISLKLGTSHIQQFCASAVNAVLSPFVLYDITLEIAHSMSRSNPAQIHSHLRSNLVSPLVQKCMQMFVQCAHQRMHHISQADYDEFVGIICSARNAFCIAPGGMVQFNDLLQSLRRSKSCRKDLWQRIVSGLATGNA